MRIAGFSVRFDNTEHRRVGCSDAEVGRVPDIPFGACGRRQAHAYQPRHQRRRVAEQRGQTQHHLQVSVLVYLSPLHTE